MNSLKEKFFNKLTKNLFNTIDKEDILLILGKDNVLLKGKPLEPDRIIQIKEEAERFKSSLLWRILSNQVKFEANKIIYQASKNIEDTRFGKAMLLNLETINKLLDDISKL